MIFVPLPYDKEHEIFGCRARRAIWGRYFSRYPPKTPQHSVRVGLGVSGLKFRVKVFGNIIPPNLAEESSGQEKGK